MSSSAIRGAFDCRHWRFTVASLAFVILGFALALRLSSPTSGFVHRPAAIISLVAACCCAACFYLAPRRPVAQKVIASILPALPLGLSILYGCSPAPKLTAEDRKQDINYLANWARDYSPFVELNEKHKGVPSYEVLKPKYVEFAKEAESTEEFYSWGLVTWGYPPGNYGKERIGRGCPKKSRRGHTLPSLSRLRKARTTPITTGATMESPYPPAPKLLASME
jgi:hypothetical protein